MQKKQVLFLVLGAVFITHALLAEFIGVKIFSLERTLGFQPVGWHFLQQQDLSFNLTAGVLLWPMVFLLTDVVNEYFGRRGVRFLSFLTAGLILYAFVIVYIAIGLQPAGFWAYRELADGTTLAMQPAYSAIFGQGLWIIIGSLVAFLVGQLVDVFTFSLIRRRTGQGKIWLRATGSTLVSQLIDSFVVLYVAFGIGAGWSYQLILAIGIMNYLYKFVVALVLTPLLYLLHGIIDRYLGARLAAQLRAEAHGSA